MLTAITFLSTAKSQIRGPALVGPGLQIRGPELAELKAFDPQGGNLTSAYDAAKDDGRTPIGILMADSTLTIQDLITKWSDGSEPGWLVGRTVTPDVLELAYQAAWEDAGDDCPIHILIARTTADAATLAMKWAAP